MAHFTRFLRTFLFSVMLFSVVLGLSMSAPAQPAFAQSGGCSISSFSMDPNENYTLGVAINLSGTSNCGTVKLATS